MSTRFHVDRVYWWPHRDLVVLSGDLAANPRVIREVRYVFKDGIGYDSPKLIEATRGLVGVR